MAYPVFLKGLSENKGIQAGFRLEYITPADVKRLCLRIAGRTFWKVWLDGELLAVGPARAAHGFARMDEWLLPPAPVGSIHHIAIEVTAQNTLGLQEETGESAFIWASVMADERELVGTDATTQAVRLYQRRECVEPYSHARPYNELYDLNSEYYSWRVVDGMLPGAFPVEELPLSVEFIPRELPYPCMDVHTECRLMTLSDVTVDNTVRIPFFPYETAEKLDTVPEHPAMEGMKDVDSAFTGTIVYADGEIQVSGTAPYAMEWEFDEAVAGFVGCQFTVNTSSVIDILHTDRSNGRLNSRRGDGCNEVIRLYCQPGTYDFESFLPYFTKYMRITLRQGSELTVHRCFLREYQYADRRLGSFSCDDETLNRIYRAAIATFRANTVDVFMDCPDRERGGWLCDSFWSGRAEKLLFGDTSVNRAMIRNYADRWKNYQEEPGFACCYPSGCEAKMPTWSLFFLLQLEEYWHMSGDRMLVDELKEHVCAFMDSLCVYENAAGLLENPAGWIFVDWSCSNDASHLQPISVAVNAMYAAGLSTYARLYGVAEAEEKSTRIRKLLCSFSEPVGMQVLGDFFPDVLTWDDQGKLVTQRVYSEACQYYCYWLGIGDPQKTSEVFDCVVEEYGVCPSRRPTNIYMTPAELFIGQFVRFDMLSRTGCYHKLKEELKYLLGYMLDRGPGTLWESQSGENSSRCHGFTSHAGVWLVRDFLGLHPADEVSAEVVIAPHPDGLQWAKGSTMAVHGQVFLEWRTDRQHVYLNARVPKEYRTVWKLPAEWLDRPEWIINGVTITGPDRLHFGG